MHMYTDEAGVCRPCSVHNRTSDKALGVDSPDGDTCSVTLVSERVQGRSRVVVRGSGGAGACMPCSIHNRASDKALGVDSPDRDTCSVTFVSQNGHSSKASSPKAVA